jgi:hypothetical protein
MHQDNDGVNKLLMSSGSGAGYGQQWSRRPSPPLDRTFSELFIQDAAHGQNRSSLRHILAPPHGSRLFLLTEVTLLRFYNGLGQVDLHRELSEFPISFLIGGNVSETVKASQLMSDF